MSGEERIRWEPNHSRAKSVLDLLGVSVRDMLHPKKYKRLIIDLFDCMDVFLNIRRPFPAVAHRGHLCRICRFDLFLLFAGDPDLPFIALERFHWRDEWFFGEDARLARQLAVSELGSP